MQEYFKIGEISRLYGIGVDSLRYYEKIGILKPERAESGYRHYSIRDIWKLNIIRDLRQLDFSMEQIGRYLQDHSIASTLDLLRKEQQTIREKIRSLEALQKNVDERIENIRQAVRQQPDQITLETYKERRCYCIPEGYSQEQEMDVLIKKLLNMDKEHLYLIGSHQIGTAISLQEAEKTGNVCYKGVFVIDSGGEKVLPGGKYLTVTYRGDYQKSRYWAEKLIAYGKEHDIRLTGDILEILFIDIHTSSLEEEYITQLQVLTE